MTLFVIKIQLHKDKCIDLRLGKRHFSAMNCFKLLCLCIPFFSMSSLADFLPAPINEVNCSADIFTVGEKAPLSGVAPIRFSLLPNQETQNWESKLQKIAVKDKYQAFYSKYWIQPWEALPEFAKLVIVSTTDFEKNKVTLQLNRFAQSEHRVAGISLEYNIDNGYFAGFLIRPDREGKVFTSLCPIKNAEANIVMSLHCIIRD